ncbi:hypothetical protein C8F04DRAFT_1065580 [Mycena alexandri]|uniref:Uncharacterized protein n=1 Tax=Mycena alexandri TaxID=1745969 RepID=A0AAD6TH94_9AGAR|nr:hypothetical protein C8F04DRAFT_1065580 [Mycena alexandri]
MEPAMPTRLDAVGPDLLGVKLRLSGQVLSYDAATGLVMLWSRDVAVLVDVSNCVSAWTGWSKERLVTVITAGYLERAPVGARCPWRVCPRLKWFAAGRCARPCAPEALSPPGAENGREGGFACALCGGAPRRGGGCVERRVRGTAVAEI